MTSFTGKYMQNLVSGLFYSTRNYLVVVRSNINCVMNAPKHSTGFRRTVVDGYICRKIFYRTWCLMNICSKEASVNLILKSKSVLWDLRFSQHQRFRLWFSGFWYHLKVEAACSSEMLVMFIRTQTVTIQRVLVELQKPFSTVFSELMICSVTGLYQETAGAVAAGR
jgi:hypothetical protein